MSAAIPLPVVSTFPWTVSLGGMESTAMSAIFASHAATPNSSGTPRIATNGAPSLGDTNFAITAEGLLPNSSAVAVLGFAPFTPPLNLAAAGAQPGSELYVVGALGLTMAANGSGAGSLPIGVPADPNLDNQSLYVQIIQFDPSLSFPLPICQSEGMRLTFGQ